LIILGLFLVLFTNYFPVLAKFTDQRLSAEVFRQYNEEESKSELMDKIESKQIAKIKKYVRRENNELKLKLQNGKEISFSENYKFFDYYKNIGYYFLNNDSPDKAWSLINDKTEQVFELYNPIALSPSKKQFISFALEDDRYKYLEIYSLKNNTIEKKWALTGKDSKDGFWQPIRAYWIDNNTIAFQKYLNGELTNKEIILKKINDNWQLVNEIASDKPSIKQCSDKKYYENNGRECDELKENLLIKKYPWLVKRNQDLLILFAQNGKKVQFMNKQNLGESSAYYSLEEYIPKINCSVVYYVGWEWGGYFIVDHLNGAQLYKGSIPIVSPKANHIVFPNDQEDFGKELPEMTIYHRSPKGFV